MPRRPRVVEEEEEGEGSRHQRRRNDDSSDDDHGENSDEEIEGESAGNADQEMVKKLVRYAMSCEYSRTNIRREGIKEMVLGKNGRAFKRVFKLAQTQLRDVWGKELRELPVREKTTLYEKRKAIRANSQRRAGSGSGVYILASTLPAAYRTADILCPSKIPTEEAEARYMGFYSIIVTVIMISGGELSDQKLQRYLMRFNADRNVGNEKTEVVLKRMEKHGYVVKRVEAPPVGQDGEHKTTWHVGPRGKEEIGIDGAVGLVREVFGQPDDPEFNKKLQISFRIKNWPGMEDEDEDEEGGEEGGGEGGEAGSAMEEDD